MSQSFDANFVPLRQDSEQTEQLLYKKRRAPVTTNYVNYTAGGNESTLRSPPPIGNN